MVETSKKKKTQKTTVQPRNPFLILYICCLKEVFLGVGSNFGVQRFCLENKNT